MTFLEYVMFLSNTAFVYRGHSVTPTFHFRLILHGMENSEITYTGFS